MSYSFPKIPKITGDTDDDVSIHLYSSVGPARPLSSRKSTVYDDEILKILQDDSAVEDNEEHTKFNELFKTYEETGRVAGEDDFDDDTEVEENEEEAAYEPESYDDLAAFKMKINKQRDSSTDRMPRKVSRFNSGYVEETGRKTSAKLALSGGTIALSLSDLAKRNRWVGSGIFLFDSPVVSAFGKYIRYTLAGLVITVVFLAITRSIPSFSSGLFPFPGSENDVSGPDSSGDSKILNMITSKVSQLELKANMLSQKQSILEINQNKLASISNEKFEEIVVKFQNIDKELKHSNNYQLLHKEFLRLNDSVHSVLENTDPNQLETKLSHVTKKLNELSEIGGNVEKLKLDILQSLLDKLPERIPVYIKDKKLHFIPEFHKYLTLFVERYNEDVWQTDAFKKVISDITENSTANEKSSTVTKKEIEVFLQQKFNHNNRQLWARLTSFIDNLTINTGNSSNTPLFVNGTNDILLENLLKIFAKGSLKINYADYNLGARILGFLTKSGNNSGDHKSLSRRLFLGWYDYLSNPKNWNYNANNALVDNTVAWECNNHLNGGPCSLGIRLFQPVILTDIVIQSDGYAGVSVYVKPRTREQADTVKAVSSLTPQQQQHPNKYLSKFVKIKAYKLDSEASLNTLKMPVNMINLRIPFRDIYLEFHQLKQAKCGISGVKVYGVTEHTSYKLSRELDLVTKRLLEEVDSGDFVPEKEQQTMDEEYPNFDDFGGEVLGDDEVFW